MAHLRYIKKNGKIYGPYSYKSIRTKDGKVKNIYLGSPKDKPNKSVVQNTFLIPAILLSLFVILFFINSQTPTGLVVVENELSQQTGDYEIEQTQQGYNIKIENNARPEDTSEVIIQDIKNLPPKVNAKIGFSEDHQIKTEIFAIKEDLAFNKATLRLEKKGSVGYIAHCQDFDFENFDCNNWEKTSIPFTDLGSYIEFEVTHFTAYAGGGTEDTASNLTIWDDTDAEGGSNLRYSEGCKLPMECSSQTQPYFFANYTNKTGESINTTSSNCSISFNLNLTADPAWTDLVNMSFNHSAEQYEYTKTFSNRGTFEFNVSCLDNDFFVANSTVDTFEISNSKPYVVNEATFIATPLQCYEDSWCYLNFSDNCTDPDLNDRASLIYEINQTNAYMWLDSATGNLSVYCTTDAQVFTGSFRLTVSDTATLPGSYSTDLQIVVSAVNDAPVFTLPNQTLYEDANNYSINLSAYYSDEENELPYFRDNYTEGLDQLFINISHTANDPIGEMIYANPTNNEVGNYSLNITVNDTANNEASQVVNFEVINVNDPPLLDWVCIDNDTNFTLTENELFTCAVNATDDDLNETWGTENLTFTANETWFTFEWQSNNESNVSFTPTDAYVGFWWINIIVTDTAGATDSKLVNITIINVSDAPILSEIGNFTVYQDILYTFSINATDEDLLIPGGGESLNFSINDTILFELGDAYISGNTVYSDISFTPGSAGDYWINFSVNDTDGFTVSELVNISIRGNSAPVLTATVDNNATEDIEFYINLTDNVTDADGDSITWSDNTTLFDINETTGEINFTANDSYVGENWVNITVTDMPGSNNSQALNFTVYNVDDLPNFTEPIGNHTAYEDTEFFLVINATDEDLDIPEGNIFGIAENLTFEVNDTSLFNIIKDNATNATINFTAVNDSQEGLYWFEINVSDTTGLVFNETINITIVAVNDAPQFVDFANITDAKQSTLVYYDFNASDEENGTDTIEGDGNLTFWIENITNATDGNRIGSITLTPYFFDDANTVLNFTTGVFTFTPNSTHAGIGTGNIDYIINLSVNDTDGATGSVMINLSIQNENDVPVLTCALLTASGFGNEEEITTYENDTNMTFTVLNVEDEDGDTLTFNWILDNEVNESEQKSYSSTDTDGTPFYSDNFSYYPGFTDAGEHNLTLSVSDGINESSDSCYRNITVLELNSPPSFILTIQNISLNQDTTHTNLDLDDHFSDVENQTDLNFTYDKFDESLNPLTGSNITIEISSTTHVVTFTPDSSWYGIEYVQFHANDSIDNVSSNAFFVNVTQANVTLVTTVATPSPSGGGGVRKKLVVVDIIHPGALTLYQEDTLITPVIIKNTNADITLSDIDIEAESTTGNLIITLAENHIAQLAPGEQKEILVTIKGVAAGFEEVIIKALVHSPEVTDSVKIFATILEIPKEFEERIRFVKDLFKENPECLELNELITRAEEDVAARRYEQALEKINTAVEKCKDIISIIYKKEKELPKEINLRRILSIAGLNIISIAFILFIAIRMMRRKKEAA